jgi:3-phenylpropionate/trans-cinnamate dioxygenase ferredoxin reductase subunit
MIDRIVIVGGGHAGAQCAVSLRQHGFTGEVSLVSADPEPPYQRPPLSKKFLLGSVGDDQIGLRTPQWYRDKAVSLHLARRAVDLDIDRRRLSLDDGTVLAYDRLLLATGSRLRRLEVPGAGLDAVHYLRSAEDARRLRRTLAGAARIVIVGGGYIGLEVAASARELGLDVTVLEREERLLPRVASGTLAQAVHRLHAARGVAVRTGAEVVAIEGASRAETVVLGGEADARLAADAVVVGIGVAPETTLAEQAGLRVEDGIVVDEFCQSSHPDVFAAGDCTSHPDRFLRRRIRLESVPNATAQGRTAASAMLGEPVPYADAPWFWSEQFGHRIQVAGHAEQADETIVRGDPASGSFALFHLLDGQLRAVEAVDRVQEFMLARRLIEAQVPVDHSLADEQQAVKVLEERFLGHVPPVAPR